ncbi:MAG: GspH/FimT family pseudopilin [Steroidobacteraceae bacterium]
MEYRGCRTPRGFTLTELLTTLAVVAIVLSAGVPGFRDFISDNRRTAQTNYMLSALARARSEAMRTARLVSVCPSTDGASCADGDAGWQTGFIVFANDDGANLGTVNAGDEIIEIYAALGGDFTLRASGPVTDFVAFRPTGVPVTGGEFAWCDSRGAGSGRAVIVRPSGSSSVSKRNAAGRTLSCTP